MMDFGQHNGQYGTFEDDHDKPSYNTSWDDSTVATGDGQYNGYSTGSTEPEAVDVYREMLETPAIDEDRAEFLETRIEDLLGN